MRVHFVSENVGGHATHHLHLHQALQAHPDVDASLFEVPPAPLGRKLLAAPVPGMARLDLDFHPLRDQLTRSAVVRRHLSGLTEPVDVLHLCTHNVGLLSVGHMGRQPTVVSLDATNEQNGYRLPQRYPTRFTPLTVAATKPLERRVYLAASFVVAQSQWAAASLIEDYGVDEERIRVIPFGIGVIPRPAAPAREGMPRITFIGRSMERKGGWWLLDLWRRYLRDVSTLTLVTPDPVPDEPGLEVVGDVRQGDGRVFELLADTAVYAFPSLMDPFGYSMLEAMVMAVPIVALGQAAVPEVVEDGVTGMVVQPGDEEAFVGAVRSLLTDPALRRRMGQAGRARVLERFDVRVTTQALMDVLRTAHTAGKG
ncbi:MAG TPA: glycosyltransferase family 4 protein [Acidimicrobiales bacterium]|nr:glycosyltransferase family 4 protein [Acidimicrobiales bacterium]